MFTASTSISSSASSLHCPAHLGNAFPRLPERHHTQCRSNATRLPHTLRSHLPSLTSQSRDLTVSAVPPFSSSNVVVNVADHASSSVASLTRILLNTQPQNLLRSISKRRFVTGPVALLLFLFGMVMAILAAVRAALVRRGKECETCSGFGVVRCRICDGAGQVTWTAKFTHTEQCSLCMTNRYVSCSDCGGHSHRRMFQHIRVPGR